MYKKVISMLKNYSCLKGIVSQDLEDHIKHTMTHHNLIVQANGLDYQVNINTQSDSIPNVKVYYTDQFSNELLTNLDKLGNEGLFSLDKYLTLLGLIIFVVKF